MRKIKAVIIEFDNGTRVGYENWPEARNVKTKFQVGDLVRCRERGGIAIPKALMHRVGVIRAIDSSLVRVEWVDFVDGNDLDGLAHRHKSGWTVYETDLEHAQGPCRLDGCIGGLHS